MDANCKQIYINGQPFKLYDEDAHKQLTEHKASITKIDTDLETLEGKTKDISNEGEYKGTLTYLFKTDSGYRKAISLPNHTATIKDGVSTEGSEIPYFEYKTESENINNTQISYNRLYIHFR